MIKIIISALLFTLNSICFAQFYLPIATANRKNTFEIELTAIGKFGEIRKARPKVPTHLHTGVDIKRPQNNYLNEPIFPIYEGVVVSLRNDGPYAQIIIEHDVDGELVWSVYEHIAGIVCSVADWVTIDKPIARFMTKTELNKYGWQFNHVHLEILKLAPIKVKPTNKNPNRYFASHWLSCFTSNDLSKYYFNPLKIIEEGL